MGYIEDIRKINDLAKELLQHNIVQSQDEAVSKAREMLVKKTTTVSQSDYIDLSKNSIPQQEQPKTEAWKDALARNNEFIVSEMKRMRSELESFTQQLSLLRTDFSQLKAQQPARREELQNGMKADGVKTEAEEAKPINHPRSGNYKPNDVAIEKFFYFGDRK